MVTRAAVCLSLRRTLSELWVVERVLAMEAVVTMEAARVAVTVAAAPEEARGAAKAAASEVAPAAARATAAMEVVAMEVVVMEVVDGVAEKLKGLAENVDFENEETFAQKVAQLKESYFAKTAKTQEEIIEDDDAPVVETSGSMDSYLKAIKKTANK